MTDTTTDRGEGEQGRPLTLEDRAPEPGDVIHLLGTDHTTAVNERFLHIWQDISGDPDVRIIHYVSRADGGPVTTPG